VPTYPPQKQESKEQKQGSEHSSHGGFKHSTKDQHRDGPDYAGTAQAETDNAIFRHDENRALFVRFTPK
jgi:hypothetical protein